MDFYAEALKRKEAMIKDLQGLIQIPSLYDETTIKDQAPFGKELRRALDYVLRKGQAFGFKTKDVDGYAGVVEFGEGSQIMGVLGHLDIVPIGTGWSVDPFKAELKDGYIMGRGSQDDKGPTMAAFYAMKILKDLGFVPKKRVFLLVGCDEESGMQCMTYYKKHGEIPDFGFVPDADFPVIYGEKGILNLALSGKVDTLIEHIMAGERPNICIGEAEITVNGPIKPELFKFYCDAFTLKGEERFENQKAVYKIYGKFSHGSRPDEGINAAWHLLNFVGSAYEDAFASQIATLLRDYRGDPLGIKVFGSHMGYLTMNIGIVSIIQGNVKIILDIRYPQETNELDIIKGVKHAFESTSLEVSMTSHKGPLFVDPKGKMVETLEKIYRSYSQDYTTPLMTMGGGTYARSFDNFVAFGAEFPLHHRPAWVGQVHQADEGYEIDQFIMATAIYAQAIYDLTSE
ncbi:MAG: dipeptidase PepV [Erysipelotrichaceae bacterium]